MKPKFQLIWLLLFSLLSARIYGSLAGGRPNAFSEGQNAFAGVVNPANAVWIDDRFDVGAFWLYQKSSLNNRDNNPLYLPSKTDLNYRTKYLFTADAAIHKRFRLKINGKSYNYSVGLAHYTLPTPLKIHTKHPIPAAGSTPLSVYNRVDATSLIFSFKFNTCQSIGVSTEYFYFSHFRNGFQNSDNPLRSVSPGHVTNKGKDHATGLGLTVGWRWNITKRLDFGVAWVRKSYTGQYRKYRGFEPHHAKNYIPQAVGGGFSYKFNARIAGRLEVLWSNFGNLPNSNNNVLSNGSLNLNKRGSNKSPGAGLQDATYVNVGMGYKWNSILSFGASLSHRIKLPRSRNILSHTYAFQTTYDILSLASNINYKKHNLFIGISYGFKNRISGHLPEQLKGGKIITEKQMASLSLSWGYLY